MARSNGRRAWLRSLRIEQLETRQLMTATPLDQFSVDPIEQVAITTQASTNSAQLTGLDVARAEFGFTGKGQTVAVIDTGIAYTHAALGGGYGTGYRVVGGYDFTNNTTNPYDFGPYGSHGTHVAGIIGSTDGSATGVAPGVDLVALRVFDNNGNGNFSWVDSALKWVHQHRNDYANPITAINLSLGTNYNGLTVPQWAMLEQDFAQLKADGIFIAVAAGNSFQSYGTPGLSYPAVSPYVVPVASEDANGQLSSFSQRASNVIVAPGSNIRSTVPDYVGNLNGKDDDFANYSGTSMASPFVAGASVLIRQAMQFVGQTNITETQIYNVMFNTASIIHDTATNADYHAINMKAALESVMGADDFGSTTSAASNLGTIGSSSTLNGVIGKIGDQDFFTFTAGQTGALTLTLTSKDGMTPQWIVNGATSSGNSLTINVVAGQKYTFGVGASNGIGHYSISGSVKATVTVANWGTVDFKDAAHLNVSGEQWAQFTASRNGILTLEAFFAASKGNLGLEIYDANKNLVRSVNSGSGERIDLSVTAGQTYYVRLVGTNSDAELRITNLIQQNGTALTVFGTTANDTFGFQAGATQQISINGVTYAFANSSVKKVTFDGGAGSDTARFVLTSGNETVIARPGSVDITGSGYEAHGTNVEIVSVNGNGGSDVAYLYGSTGADTLTTRTTSAVLTGTNFSQDVAGFSSIAAIGNGGADKAYMYDSAGKDTFTGRTTASTMQGTGYIDQALGFGSVFAYSSGGQDIAYLYDTTGTDTFVSRPTQSTLTGASYSYQANNFANVVANSSGGNDTAFLYDSAGNDLYTITQSYASMQGAGFNNQANGFKNNYGYASNVGDRAQVYNSTGNNLVTAKKGQVSITNSFVNGYLYGFGKVTAYANSNGRNQAQVSALDYIFEKVGKWV